MIYSDFITQLRNQCGDTKRFKHIDFIGDGTSNVFQMPIDSFPVLDQVGTYTVKVAGTTKTETTDYSLDKETGTLVLVSTPSNGQAVTIDSYAVYLTDSSWLSVVNSVIRSLGNDFWKEFTDTSNFTTSSNMVSLQLSSAQPFCIAVFEFQFRASATSDWKNVSDLANWRYEKETTTIYIGTRNAMTVSGYSIRLRGLKSYDIGDSVSDTLDVQSKFLTILEFGALARYWRWRYKNVVELVSKLSTENTRTPLQELIMLSDRFDRLYEMEKSKLKPQKPAMVIPQFLNNGGTP